MRFALLSVVLCSSVLLFDVDVALAKKGGGGRGPSGPSKSSRSMIQPKHPSQTIKSPGIQSQSIKGLSASPLDRRGSLQQPSLSSRGLGAAIKADPTLSNDERKLQHQLAVAQHLRDIAGRNGNTNLLQTAERMEQMAISRYQQNLDPLAPELSNLAQPNMTPTLPIDVSGN